MWEQMRNLTSIRQDYSEVVKQERLTEVEPNEHDVADVKNPLASVNFPENQISARPAGFGQATGTYDRGA